jgi:poly-gamma-glutamate capsule biosynthesis protein CapA/YwtB (metallophosphatase superfamily)
MSDSFIITSVHWGKQYSTRVLPWQETYARNLIDAGCNCILGHHPHVIQEIMSYNKGVVFFSLGNLFFDHHYEEKGHQHPKHPSTVMGSVHTIDISTEDNSVIDMRQILTLSSPKGVLIV